MYFITIINKMTDEEVKNLKFDFSWITLLCTVVHPFYKYKKCFKCNKIYTENLQVQLNVSVQEHLQNIQQTKLRVSVVMNRYGFSKLFSKDIYTNCQRALWAMWTWSLERVGKRLVQSPPSKTNNLISFSPVLNKFQAACKPLSISLCSSLWNSCL